MYVCIDLRLNLNYIFIKYIRNTRIFIANSFPIPLNTLVLYKQTIILCTLFM